MLRASNMKKGTWGGSEKPRNVSIHRRKMPTIQDVRDLVKERAEALRRGDYIKFANLNAQIQRNSF